MYEYLVIDFQILREKNMSVVAKREEKLKLEN
jgi:hypothetical protein